VAMIAAKTAVSRSRWDVVNAVLVQKTRIGVMIKNISAQTSAAKIRLVLIICSRFGSVLMICVIATLSPSAHWGAGVS
jgi:hypothetical protein